MQWYVSQNGRTSGPFSEQRVAMLVNWGKISNDAYICDDKWTCWVSVTRSHFAPLLAARATELGQRESQIPRALSEPPAASGSWFGHRLALALLLMLAAAAFLLAVWLAPNPSAGPLGSARDVVPERARVLNLRSQSAHVAAPGTAAPRSS